MIFKKWICLFTQTVKFWIRKYKSLQQYRSRKVIWNKETERLQQSVQIKI